jgi:hypothetical protein
MFKLSTSDRLSRWKTFRLHISNLSLDEAITETQELWDKCPFCPFYLEVEKPESWPEPWQLLTDNYYCDVAKCLGIVYTLYFSQHLNKIDPEIRVYYDSKTRYSYNVAYLCSGKYVLNLIAGEIVNKEHISQDLKLKHRYTAADLKLEQY